MPGREISVEGGDYKFSCAHFVAFKGFREKLHGHNYTVSAKLGGALGPDGYVIDFGEVKRALRQACKALNEGVIIPTLSDVLTIQVGEKQVEIVTKEGGAFYSIPVEDCKLLPLVHSTAEELAEYMWGEISRIIGADTLLARDVRWLEISVFERPTQGASFRKNLE
jgi:dihydroneopterin triphosphate aldolase (PTPS-III) / 6-pyruvoyltetrahydropterin synthase